MHIITIIAPTARKTYNSIMRAFFVICILLAGILLPTASYSQELKICEEGINKCQPLVADAAKYSKCMRLMCYDYYSDMEKKTKDDSKYFFKYVGIEDDGAKPKRPLSETVQACEYGLRKCDALHKNPEYYWECIADSCKTPSDARADCPQGINACVDRQRIYNNCMKFTCGNPAATFDSCPEAKFTCNESHRTYWQCVYKICLGPVDKYKRPPTSKKYMIIMDKAGKKKRVQVNKKEKVIIGAPKGLARAPEGVDQEEWIRETPQKFMLIGNPSEYMQCLLPTALLDCELNDIRSCRCSDGTMPIMLNGVPSPEWKD